MESVLLVVVDDLPFGLVLDATDLHAVICNDISLIFFVWLCESSRKVILDFSVFFCKKRDFQKNCQIQVQSDEKCDIL